VNPLIIPYAGVSRRCSPDLELLRLCVAVLTHCLLSNAVPDLFYISPLDNRAVRYAEKDTYGDHTVGGVKTYLSLVAWFLDVADLEEDTLFRLLHELQQRPPDK
jgi:hypothetical protein